MKIVFMGTPDFAVPTLKALCKEGYEVKLVVTQPDRPKGRGQKLAFSPVKQAALDLAIEVLQPEKIKEQTFVTILEQIKPDAIVVVAFGQILSEQILQIPKFGCINLHASLLPKYRGAAPIHWSILHGDSVTGNTTMLMDKGMDTGDMLLTNTVDILPEDTLGSIHDKLSITGSSLVVDTIEKLIKNEIKPQKQQEELATYAPKITKQIEIIDWQTTGDEIVNKVRGLNPFPVAYTNSKYGRLKILKAKKINYAEKKDCLPGQFISNTQDGFSVATIDGAVEILELKPESKKQMRALDFLKGHQFSPQDSFIGE